MPGGRPPKPNAERFWQKVTKTDGCWLWHGGMNSGGYSVFREYLGPGKTRVVSGHRFVYELCVGPIPENLHIDHLCGQRLCVRPDHLEPVTPTENTLRQYRGPLS